MLYHFPDESPEDLLRKEEIRLQDQIEKAKYVERYGYRPKEPTLPSMYIDWTLNKYLGCPIEKWSLPSSSKEKVKLELLATDFLPPLWSLKPVHFIDPETKEYVRRVVGFREIQQKREYIDYLKQVEEEFASDSEDDQGDDGDEGRGWVAVDCEINMEDDAEEEVCLEENSKELFSPSQRLGRGGGGKEKDKKGAKDKASSKDDKEKKGGDKANSKEADKVKKGGDKANSKDKGKQRRKTHHHDEKKSDDVGFFGKILNYFKGDDKKLSKKEERAKRKREEKEAKEEKKRKKKEEKRNKKDKVTSKFWAIIPQSFKDREKKNLKLEKEREHNLELVYKYHKLFRAPVGREQGNEWLQLSDSDEKDSTMELESFKKPHLPWMKEGISFESQFMARSIRGFTSMSRLTGRSFFNIKADHEKGHMEFTHRKRDQILFFLTSIFCWISFCLMTISFVNIKSENQAEGISKNVARQNNPNQKTDSMEEQLSTNAKTAKQ